MPDDSTSAVARAKACFVRACELDVDVRKPGNVSRSSAGHGMDAEVFIASARAAADPLFRIGARVGERVEAAVAATAAAAGCNTNLGIVLLCAPVARAVELDPLATSPRALQAAIGAVLADLDVGDAQAAFRAIVQANPGGLGSTSREDVHGPASVDLRSAMALAAGRDSIARQYRDGYADVFDLALPALGSGFDPARPLDAPGAAAIQRVHLTLLASFADSHIVRKHGEGVAHSVMAAAQRWRGAVDAGASLDGDARFAAWDESLKSLRINPGTSADLTVATLMIAGVVASH